MKTMQVTKKKTEQDVRPVVIFGNTKDEQGSMLSGQAFIGGMGLKVVADNYQRISIAQFRHLVSQ